MNAEPSRLQRQQDALMGALLAWPANDAINILANYVYLTGARGLLAYQSNGHALAERSLGATYPVIAQLLGDESFSSLARALWHAHPPVRGDLSQWGVDLPDYLTHDPQLADEPYLPDVARAEWALHTCASLADMPADPVTFALLMSDDPAQLRLVLAPGAVLIQSAWPVASLMMAHLNQTPSFEVVGQQLRGGVAQTALVWRAGLRPQVRECLPGETEFVATLLALAPLGDALDATDMSTQPLDFNTWLPLAVQTGLLLAVQNHP